MPMLPPLLVNHGVCGEASGVGAIFHLVERLPNSMRLTKFLTQASVFLF